MTKPGFWPYSNAVSYTHLYYNYYTENRWGEAKNYDLCLNAALGREACAQLIVQAAKAMEASVRE